MSQNGITDERLRVMQIIAGALMMGVITFAGVAVFMSLEKDTKDPLMAYLAVGFAVIAFFAQSFAPAIVASVAIKDLQGKNKSDGNRELTDELVSVYQTKMIIGLAILEGASFFNLIAYISSVQWWSLAVVGVLLFAMAMKFPTRFSVESWVATKQQELELGY